MMRVTRREKAGASSINLPRVPVAPPGGLHGNGGSLVTVRPARPPPPPPPPIISAVMKDAVGGTFGRGLLLPQPLPYDKPQLFPGGRYIWKGLSASPRSLTNKCIRINFKLKSSICHGGLEVGYIAKA